MSLDVLACKIVPPSMANKVYEVDEEPYLKENVQKSGFICVHEERIGRNCLNNEWLTIYDKNCLSPYDLVYEEDYEMVHSKMRIVLPGEFGDKIDKYLRDDLDGRYAFIDKTNDYNIDFWVIDW